MSEIKEFTYKIGDKTYVQKSMVFGQVRQLHNLLKDVEFPVPLDFSALLTAMGDKITLVLAIVLTEQGKTPRDKDLKAMAEEIEFGIMPEMIMEIVADFFSCNPIFSLLEKINGIMDRMITARMTQSTGSRNSLSSSPEGTLPEETVSSGDTAQENANAG